MYSSSEPFAEMDVLDRDLVLGQRPEELALGIGQPPLGVELKIEQPRLFDVVGSCSRAVATGAVECRWAATAVVIRAGQFVGPIQLGDGAAQVADDLLLLLFEHRPLAGQLQLGVADGGMAAAIADRRLHLDARAPIPGSRR